MQLKAILAAALTVACSTAQDSTELTLADILSSQDNLSTLSDLLSSSPDLATFLAFQERVTVFAPSNDALAEIVEGSGVSLEQVVAGPTMFEDVIRYHVLNSVVTSEDFTEELQFGPTLLFPSTIVPGEVPTGTNVTGGQVVGIQVVDGSAVVTSGLQSQSTIVETDLEYNNGVIHIIDSLLTIPLSVSETLGLSGLNTLAQIATDLDLVTALDESGDITLFAPTNAAFVAIAETVNSASSDLLTQILSFHVLQSTIYSPWIETGNTSNVPEYYDLQRTESGATVNGANIVVFDILVANGVIHVIDAVLDTTAAGTQVEDAGVTPIAVPSFPTLATTLTGSAPSTPPAFDVVQITTLASSDEVPTFTQATAFPDSEP